MPRQRLSNQGAVDYQAARTNEGWVDHRLRSLVSGAQIAWLKPMSVIDPACGDGSITKAAAALWPIGRCLLTDIGEENIKHVWKRDSWEARVDDVMATLQAQPDATFDVVVLTEILEHLDDPDAVLREARRVGLSLVASSPEMRPRQYDHNPEHVWSFDGDAYRAMLIDAGWNPYQKTFLGFPSMEYDFQLWVADRG